MTCKSILATNLRSVVCGGQGIGVPSSYSRPVSSCVWLYSGTGSSAPSCAFPFSSMTVSARVRWKQDKVTYFHCGNAYRTDGQVRPNKLGSPAGGSWILRENLFIKDHPWRVDLGPILVILDTTVPQHPRAPSPRSELLGNISCVFCPSPPCKLMLL